MIPNNRFIQVFIEESAMLKMQYYSELAEEEVGGLMEIENYKDKIIIKDVILLEQEASAGDFVLTEEAMGKFTENLFVNNPKKMKKIKGWWHKHPVANWSFTDDSTFERLRTYFKGYVLGVVMQDIHQKKNKYTPLVRLEIGKTQFVQFNTPHLKLIKANKKINRRELRIKCQKEIKKYVKEVTRVYLGGNYNGDDWDNSHPQGNDEGNLIFDYEKQCWVMKPKQKNLYNNYNDVEMNDLYDIGYPLGENNWDFVEMDGTVFNLKEAIGCVWNRNCHVCHINHSCMKQLKLAKNHMDKEENNEKKYLEEHFK